MKPVSFHLSPIVTAIFLFILGAAFSSPAAPDAPPAASSSTNATPAVVKSVFREFNPHKERDPFFPIGYFKPEPVKTDGRPGGSPPPPEIEPKFTINGIMPPQALLVGENGALTEVTEGGAYPMVDKEGKPAGEYKVLKVESESVTILYNEKQFKFKIGFDIQNFEKEE